MLWRQLHLTFLHFSVQDRFKLRNNVIDHKGGKLSISSLKYQNVHTPQDNNTDRMINPSNKNCFENWPIQLAVHSHLIFTCQQHTCSSLSKIIPSVNEYLPTNTGHLMCHDGGTVFVLSMRMFWICLPLLTACLPATCCWSLPWIKWSSFYPYVLDFAFEVTHCLPEALQYKNRREETWTSCYCVTE